MKNKFGLLAVLATLGCLIAPQVNAIAVGTYILKNHKNGSIKTPYYGLRLDGLLGDASKDYTFDFDDTRSNMKLKWDGATIKIFGQAFGGEDIGSTYGASTIWDINFEYTVGITQPGTDGGVKDLFVNADNANFGTISGTIGGTTYNIELEDQEADGSSTLAFQFGDENGSGHRGHKGISGWGWLNHGADCIGGDCSHVYASDWLFTTESGTPIQEVSEPESILLLGLGLVGLYATSRRKNK